MRVLLDECVPRQLKAPLSIAHDTSTVVDLGWAGLKNGALLKEANGAFDVFVTADKQMLHQQKFAGLRITIVVLPTNRLRLLRDIVPALLESLERITAGQRVVMELPSNPDYWRSVRLRQVVRDGEIDRHIFDADEVK